VVRLPGCASSKNAFRDGLSGAEYREGPNGRRQHHSQSFWRGRMSLSTFSSLTLGHLDSRDGLATSTQSHEPRNIFYDGRRSVALVAYRQISRCPPKIMVSMALQLSRQPSGRAQHKAAPVAIQMPTSKVIVHRRNRRPEVATSVGQWSDSASEWRSASRAEQSARVGGDRSQSLARRIRWGAGGREGDESGNLVSILGRTND